MGGGRGWLGAQALNTTRCCTLSHCWVANWRLGCFLCPELDTWQRRGSQTLRTYDGPEDKTCQQLAQTLESCLSYAKKSVLHCSAVLVPEGLTQRVAYEVLRLASCEPCGLRGCVLHIHLELDKSCRRLESITLDAGVVPTFELTLVLRQDSGAWPSLRDLFFLGSCFAVPKFRQALRLSPGFRLAKRKLYSSLAGTVLECWSQTQAPLTLPAFIHVSLVCISV